MTRRQWDRSRQRELVRLTEQQRIDAEMYSTELENRPRRISKAQARAQSPIVGVVTKHIVCRCGHRGVVHYRLETKPAFKCSRCGDSN